jgi:acetolactate synthase-1/2/3 large subunit
MDAMVDVRDRIDLVSCRHESGAVMMAVASGHLSGEPGIAFVTRGPGATNASIAVHIAQQGSIPLVLGVGQVASRNLGRESFQEVDYKRFFAPIAKHVRQVESPAMIPDAVAEAFHVARSGRQGPVVLAFPEDVLSGEAEAETVPVRYAAAASLDDEKIRAAIAMLNASERPLIIVGGGPWRTSACGQLLVFARERDIPVFSAFRRADIFDNEQPHYGGFLGFGAAASAWEMLARATCVLALGARLDEPTTRNYEFPNTRQKLIHVHPDARQLGLNFRTDIAIEADVNVAMEAFAAVPHLQRPDRSGWCAAIRAQYIASEIPPAPGGPLDLGKLMGVLNAAVPADTIITTDAGNHTAWPLRYRRYARPGRLIAPINGAMGYGVPAAIAASLIHPGRTVIGCIGDGGMLMTGMEIATAIKYGAKPILLVFNNNQYGTIAMHQQRTYPGREIGNALTNPDFAAFAQSFGAFGARVERTEEFAEVFAQARAAGTVAVIELITATERGAA